MKHLDKVKASLVILLVLFLAIGLVSCAGTLAGKKTEAGILQSYKIHYGSYYTKLGFEYLGNEGKKKWVQTTYPTFSAEEVKVINQKEKILQDMKTLIDVYSLNIAKGESTTQTEEDLWKLIDKIVLLKF
jgi:hypothetical protein